MSALLDGARGAAELVACGDPALRRTLGSTLRIAGEATAIAALLGVPLGCVAALAQGRRWRWLRALLDAGLRVPPVLVGQLLWLLLWPDSRWGAGPLAGLQWLYTINAAILAQTLLALPLIAALVAGGIERVPMTLLAQARALGAGTPAVAVLALREARIAVVAALLAGFGTAVATVGALLVVGRDLGELTLATAALSAWNMGAADAHAVAYGLLLLALFTIVAAAASLLQHRRRTWLPASR
ncbi:MAG: ABC transporter permease [Patulibacter sp.]